MSIIVINCEQDLLNLGSEMKRHAIDYPRDRMPILPNSEDELNDSIDYVMSEENNNKLREFYQNQPSQLLLDAI